MSEQTTTQPTTGWPAEQEPEPIEIRWDRLVIHPAVPSEDDTIVCCMTLDDGRPVALFLDDEHREALALQLLNPNPEDGTA